MHDIKKELLDILACPKCKTSVIQKQETIICTNPDCGLVYLIKNDIPVMLIDEAIAPTTDNIKDV